LVTDLCRKIGIEMTPLNFTDPQKWAQPGKCLKTCGQNALWERC